MAFVMRPSDEESRNRYKHNSPLPLKRITFKRHTELGIQSFPPHFGLSECIQCGYKGRGGRGEERWAGGDTSKSHDFGIDENETVD